jgi:hypothetical protein
VTEFCKLDLTCPVPGCGQQETRILLLEGGLKLRDKDSKVCGSKMYGQLELDCRTVTNGRAPAFAVTRIAHGKLYTYDKFRPMQPNGMQENLKIFPPTKSVNGILIK